MSKVVIFQTSDSGIEPTYSVADRENVLCLFGVINLLTGGEVERGRDEQRNHGHHEERRVQLRNTCRESAAKQCMCE